jgi:2-aminoadipate transaminase
MFVWVELPEGWDALALLPSAVEAGVAYVPGAAFASRPAPRTMRLNFSNADPDKIRAGMARLGELLSKTGKVARAIEAVREES